MGSCRPRKSKVPKVGARDGFVFSAVASSCPHDHSVLAALCLVHRDTVCVHLAHQKGEGIQRPCHGAPNMCCHSPECTLFFQAQHTAHGCIKCRWP